VNTGWLIVFALLQIGDIYTTHRVLKQGGRELNPVLAKLFEKADPLVVMVTLKLAAVWALWYVNVYWITALACAVYLYVVVNNYYEIKK
jgi:hypothetical protein